MTTLQSKSYVIILITPESKAIGWSIFPKMHLSPLECSKNCFEHFVNYVFVVSFNKFESVEVHQYNIINKTL